VERAKFGNAAFLLLVTPLGGSQTVHWRFLAVCQLLAGSDRCIVTANRQGQIMQVAAAQLLMFVSS
jgi:hypothetical protein